MEIVVLGSGSTGNATLVRSGGATILLEAGLSARQIAARARLAGFDPARVSALFVSHAHADHIQGASVFSRRHRVPAFMPEAAWETWLRGGVAARGGGAAPAAGARLARGARPWVRPSPRGIRAEMRDELDHRLDVADARNVSQGHRLVREQARGENR